MTVTHREANDQLKSFFHSKFLDGLANGLPDSPVPLTPIAFTVRGASYVPTVHYRNIEIKTPLPAGEHFLRFVIENVESGQASLPGGRQHGGATKFETSGVGIVQLFFSKDNYTTEEEDFLTAIVLEMMQTDSPTNVCIRNAVARELPPEERYFRTNVTFEYQYDTHICRVN